MFGSVTILTPGTFPVPSNNVSSVEASIMHFAPYISNEMKVTVLGKKFPKHPQKIKRDNVEYINFYSSNETMYIEQAINHLQKHPTNIIQIENRPHYVERIKEKFPNIQVWLVLYSDTFLKEAYISSNGINRCFQMVDRVIAISHSVKRQIMKLYTGIENKTSINYLGVDENQYKSRFDPDRNDLREKIRSEMGVSNKKVILYSGRLLRKKGVHNLLKSLNYLKPRFTNFVVFIVGGNRYGRNKNTAYVRRLKRLAEKHSDQIHFIPFQPIDKVHMYYLLADVLVVPSIYEEALGLVNLEGMATGLPVIASETGGIPEIIKNNETGLLVPLSNHVKEIAEKLYMVLSNEDFANQLGQRARKEIEKSMTWECRANSLIKLYKEELER